MSRQREERSAVGDDDSRHPDGEEPLVEVRNLTKHFFERDSVFDRLLGKGPVAIRAVDGVSFDIYRGETLGIVGESGCGKSTVAETMLRLQEPTDGTVRVDGEPVFDLDRAGLTAFRKEAGIVFQDPFSSLDPRLTIGQTVRESLDIHGIGTVQERNERVRELLERVGLSEDQFDRYPHEFSGGQRQRIGIARALALEPDFVVLDEPTSALDVSVQAQILNLLADLQEEFDLTYLLISHDLSVIRHICDRVAVMYLGELAEIADVETLFQAPEHPYTQALLESVPRAETAEGERDVDPLAGDVPSPRNPPSGCRFRTRCPEVIPPDDLDIDQAAYRELMHLRERVESREISLEIIAEEAGLPAADGGGFAFDARQREEFVATLRGTLLDVDLPGRHRRTVDEALSHLADEDWGQAADLLREEYESVCERQSPALEGDPHPVACHLRNPPEDSA